ncbi:hypothetical protein OIO90_005210 [Microbotryomycetes sp. JL221]|nr:hypothetical protein OIO90_005210 [Microbotryomycetes sp. JL221]
MSAIFGYGSLIFKAPPFPSITSEPGYIKGFVRRFAQKSHDHRGTEQHPGRVVTLCDENDWKSHQKARESLPRLQSIELTWVGSEQDEPPESGHIWGRVYRIPEQDSEQIWQYLDHREKDGYTIRKVNVYSIDAQGQEIVIESNCRVYVGETNNPSFAGGELMSDLAKRIATSEGPSGTNREYLYKLVEAVKQLSKEDDAYLLELERLTKKFEQSDFDLQRRRSLSKGARHLISNLMSSSSSPGQSPCSSEPPLLHLKFFSGRPPTYAARLPFADQVKKAIDKGDRQEAELLLKALPDGLRTDVQREGIARYLRNNFREGTPVHAVIHEREPDSRYIMVNANWHRSDGDKKLHLSLYVYEQDKHVETWHAYTDRSLSLKGGPKARSSSESKPASRTSYNDEREEEDDQDRHERVPSVPPSPTSSVEDQSQRKQPNTLGMPKASSLPTSSFLRLQEKRDTAATASRPDWDAPPDTPHRDSSQNLPSEFEQDWIKPPPDIDNNSDDFNLKTDHVHPQSQTRRQRKDPSPIIKSRPLVSSTSRDRDKNEADSRRTKESEVEQGVDKRHGRGRSRVTRNRGMNFVDTRRQIHDDDESSDGTEMGMSARLTVEDKQGIQEIAPKTDQTRSSASEQDLSDDEDEIKAQVRRFEQELREKAAMSKRQQKAVPSRKSEPRAHQQVEKATVSATGPPRAASRYRQPSRARSARSARPIMADDEEFEQSSETSRDHRHFRESRRTGSEIERVDRDDKDSKTLSGSRSRSQVSSHRQSEAPLETQEDDDHYRKAREGESRRARPRSVSRHDGHPSDDSREDSFDPDLVSRRRTPEDDEQDVKASTSVNRKRSSSIGNVSSSAATTAATTAAAAASSWFSSVSKSVNGLITKASTKGQVAEPVKYDTEHDDEDDQDEEARRRRREERRKSRAARQAREIEETDDVDGRRLDDPNLRHRSRSRAARSDRETYRESKLRSPSLDDEHNESTQARSRRKSISATLESGIQSIRDSVASAVNARLEATEKQVQEDLDRLKRGDSRRGKHREPNGEHETPQDTGQSRRSDRSRHRSELNVDDIQEANSRSRKYSQHSQPQDEDRRGQEQKRPRQVDTGIENKRECPDRSLNVSDLGPNISRHQRHSNESELQNRETQPDVERNHRSVRSELREKTRKDKEMLREVENAVSEGVRGVRDSIVRETRQAKRAVEDFEARRQESRHGHEGDSQRTSFINEGEVLRDSASRPRQHQDVFELVTEMATPSVASSSLTSPESSMSSPYPPASSYVQSQASERQDRNVLSETTRSFNTDVRRRQEQNGAALHVSPSDSHEFSLRNLHQTSPNLESPSRRQHPKSLDRLDMLHDSSSTHNMTDRTAQSTSSLSSSSRPPPSPLASGGTYDSDSSVDAFRRKQVERFARSSRGARGSEAVTRESQDIRPSRIDSRDEDHFARITNERGPERNPRSTGRAPASALTANASNVTESWTQSQPYREAGRNEQAPSSRATRRASPPWLHSLSDLSPGTLAQTGLTTDKHVKDKRSADYFDFDDRRQRTPTSSRLTNLPSGGRAQDGSMPFYRGQLDPSQRDWQDEGSNDLTKRATSRSLLSSTAAPPPPPRASTLVESLNHRQTCSTSNGVRSDDSDSDRRSKDAAEDARARQRVNGARVFSRRQLARMQQ